MKNTQFYISQVSIYKEYYFKIVMKRYGTLQTFVLIVFIMFAHKNVSTAQYFEQHELKTA